MTPKEAEIILEEAAAKLAEHFDSVQILGSLVRDGCTIGVKRGAGDWFARLGMAHDFIQSGIADEQAQFIADKIKDQWDE